MDSEGNSYQLITMDMNETHPVVIRCEATCLNQQETYSPAMALIITSQEQFIEVRGAMNVSSIDGLYEIYYGNISHCDAQNNYTMKFNFVVYSTSSKIDHAVLVCGVMYSPIDTPCWGQTNGIIRYNGDLATTTQQPRMWNTNSPPYSPSPLFATTPSSTTREMAGSQPSDSKLVLLYIVISIVIIIVLSVPFVAGFLYTYWHMRSSKKTAVTDEEGLVMKAVQVHSNKEEGEKKEKETVPAKVSNPSLIHSRLNQKLPDTISSRENK